MSNVPKKGKCFIVRNPIITLKNVTKKFVDKVEASQISQINSVMNNKLFIVVILAQYTLNNV